MTTAMKIVLALLVLSNVIACLLMGVDKVRARQRKWRIPEKTLFLFPVLGGAIGGCCGMWIFRHKTKHWYFVVGFHTLAVLQIAAFVYFMYLR